MGIVDTSLVIGFSIERAQELFERLNGKQRSDGWSQRIGWYEDLQLLILHLRRKLLTLADLLEW